MFSQLLLGIMMTRLTHPMTKCPKCNRSLRPSGELTVDGARMPVYSCGECLVTVEFCGEPFEAALTFCLNEKGEPFDPAAPDGKLRF